MSILHPIYRRWVPPIDSRIPEIHGWLQDIQSAHELANRLSAELNAACLEPLLIDALSCAAIVRYSRCFTSGIRARLTIQSLSARNQEEISLHEKLLDIRNLHIAHAINEQEAHALYVIIDGSPEATSGAVGFSSLSKTNMPLDSYEVVALVKLCEKWIDWLRLQLQLEQKKLIPFAKKLTRDEILSFSEDEPTPNLNIKAKRRQANA